MICLAAMVCRKGIYFAFWCRDSNMTSKFL